MDLKTAIGMMSGTSMDGIDVAMVRTDGKTRVERGSNAFYPYSPENRAAIANALEDAKSCRNREERPGALSEVEELVTRLHIEAVRKFLGDHELASDEIDVIGVHGQTVLHRPEAGYTIQLGDGERLARETGIDCVYDMRANDMAHGGQGAPLVPIYHQALAGGLPEIHAGKDVAFVNIGGISNISFIGDELVAFDTGPGNALIDQWVQTEAGIPFDQGGMIAAEGAVRMELVEAYLSNPFFGESVPKSLDRDDFRPPDAEAGSVEDVARSLAHVTAAAIHMACEHLPRPPALWIISGGGRHNPYIMQDLVTLAERQGATVLKAEDVGLEGDAMEAECWAYLAVRSLRELPLTFPGTTGVKAPVTGGKLARA